MTTYRTIRFFRSQGEEEWDSEVIETGLSEEQAEAACRDAEPSVSDDEDFGYEEE